VIFSGGLYAQASADHEHYLRLRERGLPAVLVNAAYEDLGFPRISTDDRSAVEQAVVHLRSLGHERIGMVLGPADHVPSARKLAAFEELGCALELVERTLFSTEGGQAAGTKLLRRGATAAVCGSDVLALGVIRGVRREGLRVPEGFSVVGFDDSMLMACTDPPLTTVRQPIESMGKAAVALLVNQIENTDVYPEELLFEPELVVRGSTGRPGTGLVVGALPPFCTQSALGLESASFRTRRHGHPGA
jgi:DNA-binding LacI/PurR family transcriptional regulator